MSIGKSRDGRQSPYQLGLRAPPRPKNSIIGMSGNVICGLGTPDLHHGAGEVAGEERLAQHLRVADGLDHDVGAVAVGGRLHRLHRIGALEASTVWVAPKRLAHSSLRASRSTATIVRRPGQAGTGDGGVAHAAAPEDGDGVAALHVAGVAWRRRGRP